MKSIEQTTINTIDCYLQHHTDKENFSGVVLLAKNGNILLHKGYGYANREKKIPNTITTQFRIASITKPITATLILQLCEKGLLNLTTPLSTYLPMFPHANDITIHHLLSHTSGIYNFSSLANIAELLTKPITLSSLIELFQNKPLVFEPGTNCAYSNSNYVLLTHIIEFVTGKSYEKALQEFLLDPLAMDQSGYCDHNKKYPHLALGYTKKNNNFQPADFYDSSWPLGAGGMYATAYDLYLFDKALYSNKILQTDSIKTMATSHGNMQNTATTKFYGFDYGYGWELFTIGNKRGCAHPGVWRGMRTALVRFPEDHLTIIVLCNIEETPVEEIVHYIAEQLLDNQEKRIDKMTIDDMKKLVQKHAQLESNHDLEGVLATLVENPVYEIYPAGLKLQGKENVRAFYREHFDSFFPLITSFKLINEWWNPESACMEYDLFLKEPYAEKPYRILVVLTAQNNLLLGERFYINEELAQLMSGTAFILWKRI